MAEASRPSPAAQLTLRFSDAAALEEALQRQPGLTGPGALCLQVVKYYELGDLVQLTLEVGEERFGLRASVAWRRPGYIGVRFEPATAEENRSFARLKALVGSVAHAAASAPPVAESHKPFSE